MTALHCFEKANLGTYPFRCVGVTYQTFRAAPDAPLQPGACCDYCGTGIMYVYAVVGADGRKFKVGSDCIARTGDAGLIRERKVQTRVLATERKAQQRAARTAAWREQVAAEVEARRDAFNAQYGELLARAAPFCERNDFVADVCRRGVANARLTVGQVEALEKAIARMADADAARANSTFVGKVGERLERKVTCTRIASYDRPSYGTGRMETVWIVTMRDDAGNSIVSKTPNFRAEVGEVLTIRATVKEHAEYKGEKQTVVQRVMVRAPAAAAA